jgi:hypothetical protein
MAQWIRRLPTEQEIQGSNPCKTCVSKYFSTFLFGAGIVQWVVQLVLDKPSQARLEATGVGVI